jgi:hypothetical protein
LQINENFEPNGVSIYSRAIMGDFNGDELSEAARKRSAETKA